MVQKRSFVIRGSPEAIADVYYAKRIWTAVEEGRVSGCALPQKTVVERNGCRGVRGCSTAEGSEQFTLPLHRPRRRQRLPDRW